MKVYTIEKLIDGYKVKPELRGKVLVACKSTNNYTHIRYRDQIILLTEPLMTLPQQDHYGRGTYFLDYYEWKPAPADLLWSIKVF